MARLKAVPGRLGGPPPRSAAGAKPQRGGKRRSDAPNNTARWQKLRLEILARDHWTCQQTGTPLVGDYPAWNSAVIDHITPHRGDLKLFWDPDNLQAVTKEYHDRKKQSLEKRGLA